MLRQILKFGTIAGLIIGSLLMLNMIFVSDKLPMNWAMALGYLTMLIALSAVFVGIKRYRDEQLGGVIRFWPALGMGLCISFIAGIFYVLAWEATLAITQADYIGTYVTKLVEEKQAAGESAAEIAKFVAEMDAFKVQYANPMFRMPMTFTEIFPVGVLVSLITAALLRKPSFMPVRGRVMG